MSAVTVKYAGGTYQCVQSDGILTLAAKPGRTAYVASGFDEESARRWLGSMGLCRRLAKRLLDAAIRGTGPLADEKHPRRVA